MFDRKIILDKDILKNNRIPLLCNEPSWVKLFGHVKDKNINNAKEDLLKLLDKERDWERESKRLKNEKQKTMKMILGISDSINNENKPENVHLLDEYKNHLEEINKELEEVKFQLEILPQEIREKNLQLLNATIKYGYDELEYREKIVEKSMEEIEFLRERLKEIIDRKHDYEEWVEETYLFFHGILGPKVIEIIDKERLE